MEEVIRKHSDYIECYLYSKVLKTGIKAKDGYFRFIKPENPHWNVVLENIAENDNKNRKQGQLN
jgi:hypothetical protein